MRSEWREVVVADICSYRQERVDVETLTESSYVSTANMVPNRGGIEIAEKLPNTTTTSRFISGDVLISNIRPYFKKSWLASKDGGCSNDVLVMQAKDGIDTSYLYYLLSSDDFFAYMTATSKGTKMPRGDKDAIMKYEVKIPPLAAQKIIAKTLSCLDAKIELNNKINENLEAQAQAIFKSWFVDFEPFQDGKFIESELGLIPEGWRIGKVDDIVELHDSKRVPLSSREREGMDKIYPYYGAASLMDYVEDYIFDGINLLLGEDGTVIDNDGHPILQYVYGRFWVNNHAHVISSRSAYTVEHLYILFSTLNVRSAVTGAVQKKINQRNLKSIPIILPPQEIVTKYNTVIEPFFSQRRKLERENKVLSALRDTLLPKLMSGEIEVPID